MTTGSPEQALCAVLRGEPTPWMEPDDPATIERFLAAARYHGAMPLLDAAFAEGGEAFAGWPLEILVACREATLYGAMVELASRAEVSKLIRVLAASGVAPLLLKGAALGCSHYPSPTLRPRADTDLLVPPDRREGVARTLAGLGYTKAGGVEGELVSYQASWRRETPGGATHHLDVHWRINNSQLLAPSLTYDELAARTVELPAFGPHARAPCAVDALLLACVHRAGHANAPYYSDGVAHLGERAIWLYDIHLLFTRMSAAEQDEFAALAASKRIRTICGEALRRTAEWFGTPIPQRVAAALSAPGPVEPSARYLSGGRARQMLGDFLALERWDDRGRWVRETAFPSEAYMRKKYREWPGAWLPLLHARRLSSGVAQLIRHRGGSRSS